MSAASRSGAYAAAGVDIDAGAAAVDGMAAAVRATYTPRVLSDVGAFGGLFAAGGLGADPVLVASTDGVGTKVKLAADAGGRWRGIGADLVNHCVNDILVQGARPLFFLDYVAAARLDPAVVVEVVTGMAEACRAAGCALLGGETAEMPGVYAAGALDVAGTIVGVVERDDVLPRPDDMAEGDLLVALASSGPHTNGYSLIRHLLDEHRPEVTDGLVDQLLEPHRSYLEPVLAWRDAGVALRGLAHITGGGLLDNLPRILPDHLAARVDRSAWVVPEPFATLVRWGDLPAEEAYRVFNMGIGMVAVLPAWQRGPAEQLPDRLAGRSPRPGGGARGPDRAERQLGGVSGAPARLARAGLGQRVEPAAILDACRERPAARRGGRGREQPAGRLRPRAGPRRRGAHRVPGPAPLPRRRAHPRATTTPTWPTWSPATDPDWVVLAGWMHVLSMAFLGRFPGRVVNLHPALPGCFPGAHAIDDAWAAHERGEIDRTGVMVHLVPDEGVDDGPVLGTVEVPIRPGDDRATLEARIHAAEHELLVDTLARLVRGDLPPLPGRSTSRLPSGPASPLPRPRHVPEAPR